MKPIKILTTSIVLFLGIVLLAQPIKTDTKIYIQLEEGSGFHITKRAKIPYYDVINMEGSDTLSKKEINEIMDFQMTYYTHYSYYDGYPLQFISEDIKKSDTISYETLQEYPVITFDQLSSFVKANFKKAGHNYYARSYFDQLQNMYLVKKDDTKRVAVIIKVRLDITIE